jgi:hypothetical protein
MNHRRLAFGDYEETISLISASTLQDFMGTPLPQAVGK